MKPDILARVFDALLGLRDGRNRIGGPTARGLHDDPVVRSMYDTGLIDVVEGVWVLTSLGVQCADHVVSVAKLIEGVR